MELAESIELINYQLMRDFGESNGSPKWRVVLAGEQFEKRKLNFTEEGFELIRPVVKEVRKYQHIPPNYYVLERHVPVMGETDLVTKTSYEPAWTFADRFGNYLPPKFDACKFIVETIYSQMDKKGTHRKYKDPNATKEERLKMILDMEATLFGNETPAGDALAHGFGVTDFNPKRTFDNEEAQ